MKYTMVKDDEGLFGGKPLTKERLMAIGFDDKEAKALLEKVEMKKTLNDMELVSVKGINKKGEVEEFLKRKSLKARIPEDVYSELKEIEEKSGDNLDHITEMLLRAGLDVWNKKYKPKE